jgi:hypothetical protein
MQKTFSGNTLLIYREDMRKMPKLLAWDYRVMISQHWKRQTIANIPREAMKINEEPIKNAKGVK